MPTYIYKHPNKDEYVEVIQRMNDKHEYFDEEGLEWKRVLTAPQVSAERIGTINPFDLNKATEITGRRKGTVGDLWDASKELSEKRKDKLGHEDPVKRKYFDDYQKKNKVKHFHDKPTKIEKNGISVDLSGPLFKREKSDD
jgi:hypothetical protein